MSNDRATNFLHLIRRSQRGRLKVYLGYGPGVGKTYQMLQEAHRLRRDGVDVVVGLVETHGREETRALLGGLEQVPRRKVEYRGITVEEMDLNAILARRPQVAIVDELAHSNVPGSPNGKRYQDVLDLLHAGIHVITALNVQHLESLYDTVEKLVGVKVRERLPDSMLAEADQIVNVDLSAEDLQKRLREGKIYPQERVETSLERFFTSSNLEHLREIALRELASQLDSRRREGNDIEPPTSSEQVMVCLSSRGPNSERLLRHASRLAGRLNRNWYAVYVQTPSEEPTVIDAATQRLLADTLTLANQLGATVFTYKGQDISDTILRFAKEYRVGQIVIGAPRVIPRWRRMLGASSIAEQLIRRQRGATIVVVDVEHEREARVEPRPAALPSGPSPGSPSDARRAPPVTPPPATADRSFPMPDPSHVLILDEPVSREQVLARLIEHVFADRPEYVHLATTLVQRREGQGSTFLNEGVALPHARIPGLASPRVAMAVTHGGVLASGVEAAIEAVFLLLVPEGDAGKHLGLLASVARRLQSPAVRRGLRDARDAATVLSVLGDA